MKVKLTYFPYILLLTLLVLDSCGDDDFTLPDPGPGAICTDSVTIESGQLPFSVLLNGEPWVADSVVRAGYQNGIFALEAIARKKEDSIKTIRLQISDAAEGRNTFDFNSSSTLNFEILVYDNQFVTVYNDIAQCGFADLSDLNIDENLVMGTFQADINTIYEGLPDIDLTEGMLNALPLHPLLCEPEFQVTNQESSIFGEWQLSGIYDADGSLVTYPVCDKPTTFSLSESELNGNRIIRMSGVMDRRSYVADIFNFDEDSFSSSDLSFDLFTQLPYNLFYQSQYIQLIDDARLTYSIDGNILIIANAGLGRELRFFAID